jgi:exonuclease VII small subunit
MKTTDSLFTLIKSLNKTEKGHVKKHSNFHVINDRNNYIKIFDAINAQEVYNEDKLLKKFKNERFIKQFAVAKNYLYDIILESLEAYNQNFASKLRSLLSKAEILAGKGFFKQAIKTLKKAKKHAIALEEFTYVLEIKLLEQSIDHLEHNGKNLKASVNVWTDGIKSITAQIENLERYEQLKDQLYLQYIEKGSSYTASEIKNFGWILENPLLKNKDQVLSFRAKILFHEIHALYYEYMGDFKKSYTYSLIIRQEIQKNPLALKIVANSYFSFLYNHSIRCVKNDMQTEALETMIFLERLTHKTEFEKNNLSLMVIRVKLQTYFKAKQLKEYLELIPEMQRLLKKDVPVDNLLKSEVYQQLIALLILSKQYSVAFKWFVKKNTEEVFLYNHELNFTDRLLEIIFHYELDNLNIVYKTYLFLLLKGRLNSWETNLLSFFYYLLNDPKKRITASSNIAFFLESETTHSLENNSLSYFVILSWLKSKLSDKKTDEKKQINYSILT